MQLSEFWCLVICLTLFTRTFGGTAVGRIESLDEKQCSKERKGCCDDLHMEKDEATVNCIMNFHYKDEVPSDDEKNPVKVIGFLSCLANCIYKKRNYLTKGNDDINMKGVKEHVEKTYANRPKEQQYFIQLYDVCRKEALKMYGVIKNNPATKVFFKKGCEPYYLFVYLCQVEYHSKKTCPYFVWGGEEKTPAAQDCKAAKDQCYKIDGLTPPDELNLDIS